MAPEHQSTDGACPRLIDEFRAHVAALDATIPGELEECQMFVDLEWSPNDAESIETLFARIDRDPAFTVKGCTRWLAFARICGEIRYYAASLPPHLIAGDSPETARKRNADLDAERDAHELAILPSVADAVSLTIEYLSGSPLEGIRVPRQARSTDGGVVRALAGRL